MIEVWADGSVRNGNPGIGGIGIFIRRRDVPDIKYAKLVGNNRTNNECEYEALIEALKFLSENNPNGEDCLVHIDSAVVHGHVVRGWKCNFEHLRTLRSKVNMLLERVPFQVKIVWNKRWDNEVANELAQAVTQEEKERRKYGGI